VVTTAAGGHDVPVTMPGGWFVRLEERPAASTRLYAFPHGGAGPSAFAAVAAHLPPQVEPWALNLPGRQARRDEPARTDLEQIIDEIAADLAADAGRYALFGYCGGALLAYLAARRSRPEHLFVASFEAPDVAVVPRRLHLLPSELFWERILAQGGVPPELAAHEELRPVFEPGIRADFALYAGHRAGRAAAIDARITVLYGREDPDLSLGGLLGWRRHTVAGRPELCAFPTGHWLVDEEAPGVAACLAERLLAARPGGPPNAVGHG
jgi:surfactin synthase thioesterase subunit